MNEKHVLCQGTSQQFGQGARDKGTRTGATERRGRTQHQLQSV